MSEVGATLPIDLNTGAFGAVPESVRKVASDLRERQGVAPHDFMTRHVPDLLWRAREELAGFVGADSRQLVLTTNVTAGVNLLASTLPLEAPGEIVLSDAEYAPMRWTWDRAAARRGLTVRTVSLHEPVADTQAVLAAFDAAIGAGTRVVFISHVLSATGTIMPVAEICSLARERGALAIVDGAHGPVFTDLAISDLGCDFYVGSGHKWMQGPPGLGFVACGDGWLEQLEPEQVSWAYELHARGRDAHARNAFGSTPLLRRHECQGTRDLVPWLVLPAVVEHHRQWGPGVGRAHAAHLAAHLRSAITSRFGWVCLTPEDPETSGGMVSFRLPLEIRGADLADRLWQIHRISVATFARPTGDVLRISIAATTAPADLEGLEAALADLLSDAPLDTPDHPLHKE